MSESARGAEVFDVIDADRRHARNERRNHVRRIEAAAESGFDDGDVHPGFVKERKRHCGGRFEKRRAEPLDFRRPLLDEPDDAFGIDSDAVDDETLAKVHEVRRRVHRDAQPFRAERRLERRADAPLAVRAGDVNRMESAMGIAERAEKSFDALEAEFPDAGRTRVEKIERVAVRLQLDAQPVAAGFPLMWRSN